MPRSWRSQIADEVRATSRMHPKKGQPTAIKVKGTGFYDPAITTAFRPKRLPHGDRQNTRYAAIKEARRVIEEAGR